MKLEVANKHNVDTYWVATTIATCGQLLLLRYCGYEDDRRADFWCDVMTADLHPVGWCTQNGKVLMPPDGESELIGQVSSPGDEEIWNSGYCSQTYLESIDFLSF